MLDRNLNTTLILVWDRDRDWGTASLALAVKSKSAIQPDKKILTNEYVKYSLSVHTKTYFNFHSHPQMRYMLFTGLRCAGGGFS